MYSKLPVLKLYLKNSQIDFQKKDRVIEVGLEPTPRLPNRDTLISTFSILRLWHVLCVTGNSIFGEYMFIRPSHNFLENWWIKHSLQKHHNHLIHNIPSRIK